VLTSLAMAACFGLLAAAWPALAATRPDLLALLFLVLYALFSAANGLNQLVLAALQGKLISPGHRGRAMVVSVAVGSVLAIVAAVGLAAMVLGGQWLLTRSDIRRRTLRLATDGAGMARASTEVPDHSG
jgi:hypothetical protein